MPGQISALYVCNMQTVSRDALNWRQLVLARIEQARDYDVHVTMVPFDAQVLYLVEGEQSAVRSFLNLVSTESDRVGARAVIEPTVSRWNTRPGCLMTPLLSQDEKRWLSARLDGLERDSREIQACLRWANMRTREAALFNFCRAEVLENDSFPSAVPEDFGKVPGGARTSLDLRADRG